MFSLIKNFKGYLIGAAVILPLLGFLYWQNSDLHEANLAYAAIVQQKELALKAKDIVNEELFKTIDRWEESQRDLIRKMEELQKISVEANQETRNLTNVFSKHNLGRLASRKPTLIEKRINRGTASAFRMLECASGSTDRSCGAGDKSTARTSQPAKSGTD